MGFKRKKIVAAIFILLLCAGWVTYRYLPGKIIKGLQKIIALDARLTKKSVDVDGYLINYYAGGMINNPVLILLHGLGDDKNSFVRSVSKLTDEFQVILPDLPGHGDNKPSSELNYGIVHQVNLISKFIDSLHLSSFYLGGNSMGGHCALAYANLHSSKVRGLILINTTGIAVNGNAVYQKFPVDMDKTMFAALLSRVFASSPNVPDHFLEYARKEMNAKTPFLNQLIQEVIEDEDFFSEHELEEIMVPALILWGKQDGIVPLDFAYIFHKSIPNSTIQFIEYAGHTPQFETPEIVGKAFEAFIRTTEENKLFGNFSVDQEQ